jgi:hypothetical protein
MKLPRSSVDRLVQSLGDAPLGDARRQRRLCDVVERLARAPSASLPAALGSDARVQGCYRLLNNPAVTFDALLTAQADATRLRAKAAKRVLVLHDTTDCSFPHLDPEVVGYLQTGKAGFRLHVSIVVEAEAWRRPLGVIHAECVTRDQRSRRGGRNVSGTATAQWEDREFKRWWRGMQAAQDCLAPDCQEVIHVADRESDSYELMAQLLAAGGRFVLRVRADRRGRSVDDDDGQWSTVRQVAGKARGLLERDVPLSRRKAKPTRGLTGAHPPRKKRLARLHFAATRVVIPRPIYLRDPLPKQLELNLVHVTEPSPPEGEPPVEWLLYTTEPVGSPAQCAAVVDTYRTRWVSEEFNSALKTGCAYEDREFETPHALHNALAISLPIACELLWLRSRARDCPHAPASDVLSVRQIEILRALGSHKLGPSPTAQDALLAVAALGGHLKRNGPPGWRVLQRGMNLLVAYEVAWAAAESRARRRRKM